MADPHARPAPVSIIFDRYCINCARVTKWRKLGEEIRCQYCLLAGIVSWN